MQEQDQRFPASLMLSLTVALSVSLSGCKTTEQTGLASATAVQASSEFPAQAAAAAEVLQKKHNPYELQTEAPAGNDCHPLIVPADLSVPFKGTAVLFHGYTNCPQQFNELAAILAKKGVQTFAPLAPGHGRAPVPLPPGGAKVNGVVAANYYGEFLPRVEMDDWQRYERYVEDVNAFVATLPGPKMVSGLSLGGAMATYAYVASPGLYARALITSPFYGTAGSYLGRNQSKPKASDLLARAAGDLTYHIEEFVLGQLAKDMKVVGGLPFSWGPSCYEHNAGHGGDIGRRGICDFRIDNLSAVAAHGRDVLTKVGKVPGPQLPQVQYMFAEWDKAADTRLVRQAAAMQQAAAPSGKVDLCTYPHIVPHSFFSRTDIMDIADPFWLSSFLQIGTDFLAFGDPIPLDQTTPSEEVAFDADRMTDSNRFLKRCAIYPLPLAQAVEERS